MRAAATPADGSAAKTQGVWFARGRRFGLGVLIAFTLKGICTTTIILTALFSTLDDSVVEMAPHLLAWTLAAIGGFCLLGGWRRGERHPSHKTQHSGNPPSGIHGPGF